MSLFFFPAPPPKPPKSSLRRTDELKFVSEVKTEIDQKIVEAQKEGWRLYCRAFSLDDGHSATLRRGRAE